MSSIAQPWLISKFFDPVFAIFVGGTAAVIRIRRDQLAKYPEEENDFGSLWKKAQRMGRGYMTAYSEAE